MTVNIKKAIIPVSGARESLYPFEVSATKELFPLGEVPAIYRVIDELEECKVEEVILLLPQEKKDIIEHFKNLKKESEYASIKFSHFLRKRGTKTVSAISRAKEEIDEDNFFLAFPDMIFAGKKPSAAQLLNLHRTSKKMVFGLAEVEEENVSKSYIAETEKIANRFYKISKIIKKPSAKDTDSRLALVPRYIFTPLLFNYLGNGGKETLFDAINSMIASGKTVYGYVCEGEWFSLREKEGLSAAQHHFINKNENE